MTPLLYNSERARIVHAMLHKRLVHFIERYTPDVASLGDTIVTSWLNRFYAGDPSIIIMVYQDEHNYAITAHSIIEVQQVGHKTVVCVHQLEYDVKLTDKLNDCMKFVDDLVDELGAHSSLVQVCKNVKVYEKKYGYSTLYTSLVKVRGDQEKVEGDLQSAT